MARESARNDQAAISASPAQAEPERAGAERLRSRLSWAIVGMAILARVWMAHATHATGEDFLIIVRYAANIANGQGFVYNVGERVLGSTTPLYTLLLAGAAWLHLDAVLVGKGCNILADGLTCRLLYRLLARREMDAPMAGLFAALIYAFGSTPISISISGMETALVTCAGLAAVLAYVEGNWRALLLLTALLFLLRIDTLLLTTLLVGGLAWRTPRVPWRDAGLALLLVLPWIVFACLYFGSPVPTSLVAKLTVYRGNTGASRASILASFATQFTAGWPQRVLTLLAAVGAVQTLRLRQLRLGLPLLWLLLYYGTMLTSHVPAFPWYFLPPWPLYLALVGLGGQAVVQRIEKRGEGRGKRGEGEQIQNPEQVAWIVVLALVGVFGIDHLRSVRADITRAQVLEDRVREPLGLWLRANARPEERILLEPIGTIGYYSRRPILDMIGLVSPEVFPSYRTTAPLADIVRRLHPDWLCLRPIEAARLRRDAPDLLETRYTLARDFRAPDRSVVFVVYHVIARRLPRE